MATGNSTKLKILLAAAEVTTASGAGHLTLDRVAEVAAISKGGLLYHYPNKRALLQGMLNLLIERFGDRVAAHQRDATRKTRPVARSLVLAEAEQDEAERAMQQALLAAVAEDPELLDPARSMIRTLLADARSEGPDSLVLLLATEGLRFLDVLGLLPDGPNDRQHLVALLCQAAEARP
ncbi:MAG: TetR family transcriptional regulator [Pseudomonadota bacterium]